MFRPFLAWWGDDDHKDNYGSYVDCDATNNTQHFYDDNDDDDASHDDLYDNELTTKTTSPCDDNDDAKDESLFVIDLTDEDEDDDEDDIDYKDKHFFLISRFILLETKTESNGLTQPSWGFAPALQSSMTASLLFIHAAFAAL